MLTWAIFLGLFTLFFGLLFIFSPKILTKMSVRLNKMVHEVDIRMTNNRMTVGVVLVLLSLFLFYYASKLVVR
jgi:drug/metabolite transporter (DMT)-like permease